jgi:cohesin loading factor subunit SCC2
VANHLGGLSIAAAIPSYIQPQFYAMNGSSYPQGNPPPYSEYASEVSYLGSQQAPANDSGYWENTRNDTVRYIGEQAGQYVYARFFSKLYIDGSIDRI